MPEVFAIHPLAESIIWLRWSFALAVCFVGPAILLARAWPRSVMSVFRIAQATAFLFMVVAAGSAFAATFALPWPPAVVVGLPWLAAVLLPLSARFVRFVDDAFAIDATEDGRDRWVPVVSVVLLVWIAVAQHDQVVPAVLHDVSNHTFLVARIAETESVRQDVIFGVPWGAHRVPYFVGWHAIAAGLGWVAGTPPYVTVWLSALCALASVPLVWAPLWRRWGIGAGATLLALGFLVSNRYYPVGYLDVGLYGGIVGVFVLPAVIGVLAGLARRPGPWRGLIAGVILAGAFRVQAAMAAAVLVLWPFWLTRPVGSRRAVVTGVVALLAALAIGLGPEALEAARGYQQHSLASVGEAHFGRALNVMLNLLGRWDPIKIAVLLGIVALARTARWRGAAWTLLGLAIVYVGLDAFGDPITSTLGSVFYREPRRVRTVMVLLFAPIAATALLAALRRIPTLRGLRTGVGTLVIAGLLVPEAVATNETLSRLDRRTLFGSAEYAMARRLHDRTDSDAVVANAWDDGSVWARWISERTFLNPCNWSIGEAEGLSPRPGVAGLGDRPWPASTWELFERGVEFVWVSDHDRAWRPETFTRERFDSDPRFEKVDEGGAAALYRVLWTQEER